MNILHVIDMISQQKAGGSAKVPYQLGEAQARLGHKVTIFVSDWNAKDMLAPAGVKMVKYHCLINYLGGMKITPGIAFACFGDYNIIHLHNYRLPIHIIPANQGIPVVLQAHGSCIPLKSGMVNLISRNLIFNRASAYIADAEMEVAQYVAEGADIDKVKVIPVGIDCNEFAHLPERKSNTPKRVLFLGRFHEIKGASLLVRAMKILGRSDVVLAIAGYDDGDEAALRQLIQEIGMDDKVVFLGPRYGDDKVREYTQADVYVMPSRYEMFGLTLLEALACGTPVIITDRCGIAPLLPKECGIVVPLDEYALSEAIAKALDSNMADNDRDYRIKWARQYDWDNIAPKVIEVYEKVVEG